MWVVLLIGRAAWEICLRGHFAGKPVVASRKLSCLLRLSCAELKHLHFCRPRYKCLEKTTVICSRKFWNSSWNFVGFGFVLSLLSRVWMGGHKKCGNGFLLQMMGKRLLKNTKKKRRRRKKRKPQNSLTNTTKSKWKHQQLWWEHLPALLFSRFSSFLVTCDQANFVFWRGKKKYAVFFSPAKKKKKMAWSQVTFLVHQCV